MKKHFTLWNLFLLASFCAISYTVVDAIQYIQFVNRVEAINDRIDYLHFEEGYSVEAAKHITDVEFGLCPADAEYNALIED